MLNVIDWVSEIMITDFYQLTMIKTFLASESEHKSLHSVFGQQQQLYSENNIILEKNPCKFNVKDDWLSFRRNGLMV